MVESTKQKTVDDYECPICYELCAEPVVTPCKHFFCLVCQKQVMQAGFSCPLCRAHFDKLFVPQVDVALQNEIMEHAKEAFEERKQKLIKQGQWRGNKKSVFISVGNTHEMVQSPKPAQSESGKVNSHRWAMFVCLSDGRKEETSNYIESVTYHLHPTFKPNVIKVEKAPFLLSRIGWGYFEVEIEIVFKKSTGLLPKKMAHELNFEADETKSQFEIEIASEDELTE